MHQYDNIITTVASDIGQGNRSRLTGVACLAMIIPGRLKLFKNLKTARVYQSPARVESHHFNMMTQPICHNNVGRIITINVSDSKRIETNFFGVDLKIRG